MNFKEIKEHVRIVDVLVHYGIRLRCKVGSEYASTACPLPTHPPRDKGNNAFGVHIPSNRWQCKHPECGAKNGVADKWGDCINLVMTMENLKAREAAEKIEAWFPKKKAAPHTEARAVQGASAPLPHISDNTSPSDSVKVGYMQAVGAWFDAFIVRRPDEADDTYLKRIRKGVMNQIFQSHLNGKKNQEALST
jgi:hypothetical protein